MIPFKDCIIFNGNIGKNGYGQLYNPLIQRTRNAHRVIWEKKNGPLPKGMCIMHLCDNRACINLKHLKLGTYSENIRDMHQKRRWCDRKGEKHPMHKLTDKEVEEIRVLYPKIKSQRKIAKIYNISQSHVFRIINLKERFYGAV